MRFIGSGDRQVVVRRSGRAPARALVVSGVAAALIGAGAPAAGAAASFVTATGCPHHQAFIEGDDAAVDARLPDRFAPVRTASGAPLLFVRAIRCDTLGVDGKA